VKLAAEGLDIRWEGLRRRTEGGLVAADLIISVGGVAVRCNVYLRENAIELKFQSKDRSRVELAARLLRLVGVDAELERDSSRDVWRVYAYTDVLASASEELRASLANIVRRAVEHGWVDEEKARRWLEKLEGGVVAWEGKKFMVRLSGSGALEVSFRSTSRKSVEDVIREFKAVGLYTRRGGAEPESRGVPQIP
jgi:hypothetical protein